MRLVLLNLVGFLVLPFLSYGATLEELSAEYTKVRHEFDVTAAEELLVAFEGYLSGDDSAAAKIGFVRSALLVAELNRLDYEQEGLKPLYKRELGKKIDAAAERGHAVLAMVEESSERYRMTADLWGTMIRSNFQGKKHGKKMETATEKALALDENNPNAHVTAAKRPLFAPEKRGGDWDKAMAHLEKALSLDPESEPALILRGMAHEKNGDMELARKDWARILELNPNSRPAVRLLEKSVVE
jgi:tetratricopeptide (TPR) repeat protein